MDQELKQYLEGMEARTTTKFDAMNVLLNDVKESLERQINSIALRFDAQAIRLDRQAALIQTGSRWTNRMNKWSEKLDVQSERTARELAAFQERLEKLEGGKR
jgi:hypothetical protein